MPEATATSAYLPVAETYEATGLARLLAECAEIEPAARAVLGRILRDCPAVRPSLEALEVMRRRHELDPHPASFQHALMLETGSDPESEGDAG